MKSRGKIAKNILEELLLYSGQFGLFYLIMQLIIEKGDIIYNNGHIALILFLIVQAILLSVLGDKLLFRFGFSFIVPIVYSSFELIESTVNIWNAAHIGFWIYALISTLLMVLKKSDKEFLRRISEILFVVVNVFIFIFLYYYFDVFKGLPKGSQLTIFNVFNYLGEFLTNPTHWYIIIGGVFLAVTIALGRYEIALLKDKIASLFGQYVDSNIRDTIIEKGEFIAENKNLCILFSDIESFTTLCEKNDASSIAEMLNTYFEYWNTIVKKYNGTVDKYIGDAIMVIFGLDEKANPCDLAVECALEAYNNRAMLFDLLNKRNLPVPSGFGIGCHYGELIIGDIGSKDRKNFTVIGDTVNIASRLESITRKVKNKVIVCTEIYENQSEINSN